METLVTMWKFHEKFSSISAHNKKSLDLVSKYLEQKSLHITQPLPSYH